ncbi:MAG: hypothetical protein ACLSVD_17410 [Eggerthellaceae bacterium]
MKPKRPTSPLALLAMLPSMARMPFYANQTVRLRGVLGISSAHLFSGRWARQNAVGLAFARDARLGRRRLPARRLAGWRAWRRTFGAGRHDHTAALVDRVAVQGGRATGVVVNGEGAPSML